MDLRQAGPGQPRPWFGDVPAMHPRIPRVHPAWPLVRRPSWIDRVRYWVHRMPHLNVHIGVVLAGAAFIAMLFNAVIDGEGTPNAWQRLINCVGAGVFVVGFCAALTAADRKNSLDYIQGQHREILASIARASTPTQEAVRQAGWDLDAVRQQLADNAITGGRMSAQMEQISASMAYLCAELARLKDAAPSPEAAQGGPAAREASVLQRLDSLEQAVEELLTAGMDAEVIELGHRISRKIQGGGVEG